MSLIPFPNIPKLPGVPALPRLPGVNLQGVGKMALGIVQGALWSAFQVDSRWGIYDKNGRAFFDTSGGFSSIVGSLLSTAGMGPTLSFNGVEFSADSKVADFPVEKGSFASYNKVETPYIAKVTICLSGSEATRTALLLRLENSRKSTELFDVVTPELRFADCTLAQYSYRRTSQQGATMLRIECTFMKVRQAAAQYANKGKVGTAPKAPSALPSLDVGKVQAAIPGVSTLKSLATKLPALASTATNLVKGFVK